jgi:hypothetical protein
LLACCLEHLLSEAGNASLMTQRYPGTQDVLHHENAHLSLCKAASFSKYISRRRKYCLAALVLGDSLENFCIPSGLDFWRGPFL